MKKTGFVLAVLGLSVFSNLSNAQIISTPVGIYYNGFSGDGGQATSAELNLPEGVAFDSAGNLYVADTWNYRVRKIDRSTGIITTVAGGGTGGIGDGGQATAAIINGPSAVAFDKVGNLYIADGSYHAIRKVDATTGIITSVVGIASNSYGDYTGDGGQATAASLDGCSDIAFDKMGNLYFADCMNNVIRKVTASTGIISTIAGNGYGYWTPPHNHWGGYSGDGGQATSAEMYDPTCIALDDSDNLYISDFFNNVIRKVNSSTGIITTFAGNGYKAGLPGGGYTGDGGQATAAEFIRPFGVRLDASNNLFISDYNNVVRKVDRSTGIITTVVGNGINGFSGNGGQATSAELNYPQGLEFDKLGNLYITDNSNAQIRKVTYNTSGVNEINISKALVYPNPTKGSFTLVLSNISEKCGVEIFNVTGEKIYSETLNDGRYNTIDLATQPNGIYFYKVLKESGELIGSGKLIIEK